jgi:hypothetical protein
VITKLGDMSTDEVSRAAAQTDDHLAPAQTSLTVASTSSALRGVVPLVLLMVIFIAYAVPPYVTLDPARARIQPMPRSIQLL